MKKLTFTDKRITALLKFLCDNDEAALELVSSFFGDIDDFLLDVINAGLNFEGEYDKGYYRINFKKEALKPNSDKTADMLEITEIIDGSKLVLSLHFGLLHKGVSMEELSKYVLMEVKGVFNEEEVLNENFEYRNAYLWAVTENGEIERYLDNMLMNNYEYDKIKVVSPLRDDVLEESYESMEKPELLENNFNLYGDTLLIKNVYLPYYGVYKKMFADEVMRKRREVFFGKREEGREQ